MLSVARRLAAWAAALATLGSAARAAAQEGDACITSYEEAQRLQKRGALVQAKAELRLCLGACPQVLTRDCARWLKEVEPKIARLSVAVQGTDDGPLKGARVLLDGVPTRLGEGGAMEMEVDPGPHTVRAEAPARVTLERQVEVAPGAQVALELRLEPEPAEAPPPPPPPPVVLERGAPIGALVLGGVGLLGLGVGGALGIAGHVERSRLGDECAPFCSDADVDVVRRLWIAGGVAAGAGALAVGVAVGLLVARSDDETAAIHPVLHLAPGTAGLHVLGRF